jgi:hypothetical protein
MNTDENEQGLRKIIDLTRLIDNSMVQKNYLCIKQDLENLVDAEMGRMTNDPEIKRFIIKKN